MLTPRECADAWKEVILCYDNTREEKSVVVTMNSILDAIGYDTAKEVFAIVAAFKKHDGRIYGANRDFINGIATDPLCVERNHDNPMFGAWIDHIHPAIINQMITELRKAGSR